MSTARALLIAEGGGDATTSADSVAASVHRVWTQLAHRFARLIGDGGIHALQDRSVRAVAARLTWLAPPPAGFGDDWEALRVAFAQRAVADGVAAFEELVAGLIALLGRFIGDALVSHLLHEMWPDVFPDDAKELT